MLPSLLAAAVKHAHCGFRATALPQHHPLHGVQQATQLQSRTPEESAPSLTFWPLSTGEAGDSSAPCRYDGFCFGRDIMGLAFWPFMQVQMLWLMICQAPLSDQAAALAAVCCRPRLLAKIDLVMSGTLHSSRADLLRLAMFCMWSA